MRTLILYLLKMHLTILSFMAITMRLGKTNNKIPLSTKRKRKQMFSTVSVRNNESAGIPLFILVATYLVRHVQIGFYPNYDDAQLRRIRLVVPKFIVCSTTKSKCTFLLCSPDYEDSDNREYYSRCFAACLECQNSKIINILFIYIKCSSGPKKSMHIQDPQPNKFVPGC